MIAIGIGVFAFVANPTGGWRWRVATCALAFAVGCMQATGH